MTDTLAGSPEKTAWTTAIGRPFAGLQSIAAAGALVALLSCGVAEAADCRSSAAEGVDWQECDKKVLILSGSTLAKARLAGTDFTSTDLRDSDLSGANLEKATLVRASLAGSKAPGANFTRIEAFRTDFSDIDAGDSVFAGAEMQRSTFTGANLANADFTKAELGRAMFDGADVTGSKFALANLARADFRTAKLGGVVDFANAFLFLTRLEGIDLSKATGLAQWQVDMACGDEKTVLPAGLAPSKSWPCQFEND